MSFITADEFSLRVTKIISRIGSHELAVYLSVFYLFTTHEIAILSKGCKLNNFESHISLELSFTNI